jgi:hypothetical protein
MYPDFIIVDRTDAGKGHEQGMIRSVWIPSELRDILIDWTSDFAQRSNLHLCVAAD